MNNILKSCLVLFIVSAVCVTALAYVNEITLEPIAAQERLAESNAYKEIFPNADDFKKDEATTPAGGLVTDITAAYSGGEKAGYIVRVAPKGYGGAINMMTGFDMNGSLSGIVILSHSETPGLGAICESPSFTVKFKGKSNFPLSVIKSGTPSDNEIDAITSATITSKAVADGVNAAYEWFKAEGGGK